MTRFVQWLSINPWVWLILALVSVAAFVSAFVFYYKSKRLKEPMYVTHSTNLIWDFSSILTNLEIAYAGKKVNNLTSTKIVLWNNGRETIFKSDIAPADPLAIQMAGDGFIMDCYLIAQNNPANQVSVELVSEKQTIISFDFLDYKQGAVIQVLHTGNSSSDLALRGTVIGAGNFNLDNRYGSDRLIRISFFGRRLGFSSLLGILIGIGIGSQLLYAIIHRNTAAIILGLCAFCANVYLGVTEGSTVLPELPNGLGTMNADGWQQKKNRER